MIEFSARGWQLKFRHLARKILPRGQAIARKEEIRANLLVLSQESGRCDAKLAAAFVGVEGNVKVPPDVAGPDRFPIEASDPRRKCRPLNPIPARRGSNDWSARADRLPNADCWHHVQASSGKAPPAFALQSAAVLDWVSAGVFHSFVKPYGMERRSPIQWLTIPRDTSPAAELAFARGEKHGTNPTHLQVIRRRFSRS